MNISNLISKVGFFPVICRTILVLLCILISFSTYPQPPGQLQQQISLDQLNRVVHKGVDCYKLDVNRSGMTLRDISQYYNLHWDTLRAYNKHLGAGDIAAGSKIYYPVNMIPQQDRTPRHPSSRLDESEEYTFNVVDDNNNVITRRLALNDFTLRKGEQFAAVKYGTELIKSDTLKKFLHNGKELYLQQITIPAVYFVNVQVGDTTTLRKGDIDFLTLPIMEFKQNQNLFSQVYKIKYSTRDSQNEETIDGGLSIDFQSLSGRSRITPQPLIIEKTNLLYNVSFSDSSFYNPLPVHIIAPDSTYNFEVVKQPVIRIETKPRDMLGYGIERIPVRVSMLAYTSEDSVKVYLSATKGSLKKDYVYLSSADHSKTVYYRSAGSKGAEIEAFRDGFSGDSKEFGFVFPYVFLALSISGGLIGGLIKYLMDRKNKILFNVLLLGAFTGFLVALLWVLGLIVHFGAAFGEPVYNESMVLVLSILGALYWEKIYTLLSKHLISKKT